MRNLALAASLIFSLSSAAFADRAYVPPSNAPHFAQPPDQTGMLSPVFDRAAVRNALVRERAANLASFRTYRNHRVFPSNTFTDHKLNVWRDADGHLCAAATIINANLPALAAKVAEQNNFIRLADVREGPLMDWILTSGFTQEEVAAIQEPFEPVSDGGRRPIVNSDKRARETARLVAYYANVDAALMRNGDKSIDAATDRLIQHQALAAQLVAPVTTAN